MTAGATAPPAPAGENPPACCGATAAAADGIAAEGVYAESYDRPRASRAVGATAQRYGAGSYEHRYDAYLYAAGLHPEEDAPDGAAEDPAVHQAAKAYALNRS